MPAELPYLASYKNVGALFDRIKSAKVPDAFTQAYLSDSLGLKGSGDRALIALLKALQFIDAAGRPQSSYSLLKNEKAAKAAIATAIRKAYEPLFASNEKAHSLSTEVLKGLVAQVAGAEEGTTSKIVGTFKSLVAQADFEAAPPAANDEQKDKGAAVEKENEPDRESRKGNSLRPEFHYNIQIHLPANSTEETYRNIFNAIRNVFE